LIRNQAGLHPAVQEAVDHEVVGRLQVPAAVLEIYVVPWIHSSPPCAERRRCYQRALALPDIVTTSRALSMPLPRSLCTSGGTRGASAESPRVTGFRKRRNDRDFAPSDATVWAI